MKELKKYYNATTLSKKCDVHYKTVLYWFRTGRIKGAHRSPTSNEILIPTDVAHELMRKRGIVVE